MNMTEDGGRSGNADFSRIPTWDGNPATWWKYKAEVELWKEAENLKAEYSLAARMVQKLTGTARIRANLIDLEKLRPQRPVAAAPAVTDSNGAEITPAVIAVEANWTKGIDFLMEELEKMIGVTPVVKKAQQRSWFYNVLKRKNGEAMNTWLTRFRAGLKRCADDGVDLSQNEEIGWWLVEKSGLSKERKERLMSRLSQDYDYAEVEKEMLQIFPEIHIGEGRGSTDSSSRPRGGHTRRANVTDGQESVVSEGEPQGEPEEEDGSSMSSEDRLEHVLEEELSALAAYVEEGDDVSEGELENITVAAQQINDAMITMKESRKKIQAARKDRTYTPKHKPKRPNSPHPNRSAGSSGDRPRNTSEEIKKRKAKSNCSVCGRRGHWSGDPECPGPDRHARVCVCIPCLSGDDPNPDSIQEARVSISMHNDSEGGQLTDLQNCMIADNTTMGYGAADSACNRTCCGGRWMDYFTGELDKLNYPYLVNPIKETFRFGGGERLVAEQQYVIPIGMFGINGLLKVCVIRDGKGNELELFGERFLEGCRHGGRLQ